MRNDAMSSIKVMEGCVAIVYEHGDFKGWSAHFPPGSYPSPQNHDPAWKNDKASAIEVLSLPLLALSLHPWGTLAHARRCEADCSAYERHWFSCGAKLGLKSNQCGPGSRPVQSGRCVAAYRWGCIVKDSQPRCHCDTHCKGEQIWGFWHAQEVLVGDTRLEVGTKHSSHETMTSEWRASVVSRALAKLSDLPGHSLSRKQRMRLVSKHRSYFQMTKLRREKVNIPRSLHGKYLWQWMYYIRDSCGYSTFSRTLDHVVTPSRSFFPCCLPGGCLDWGYGSCTECTSKEMLITGAGSHCTVWGAAKQLSMAAHVGPADTLALLAKATPSNASVATIPLLETTLTSTSTGTTSLHV